MTKHIKKEPTNKDRERLFTFIEHSNDPDDRSLANIWLQKFDHWEEKALLAPKPRAKLTRMKPSSQIQASAKSVNKEKLSLPRSEDPKAGFSFSVEELPSKDHVPAKVLTKEMIAQWKVRFKDLINKMYAYDPTKGEQNR